jgi:beta-N-acetylhexosaminidase
VVKESNAEYENQYSITPVLQHSNTPVLADRDNTMTIKNLTDAQSAGQRLMVGFDGTGMSDDLKFMIRELHVGGVILFSRNISAPEQVRGLCASIQEYAQSFGEPALFIAIDQEGGAVARLKKPFTEFAGNPHMTGIEDAADFAGISARELTMSGINMNMAPVLDVAFDPEKSIMSDRAFGDDPAWVAALGTAVIENLQQGGVLSVAKHFPGIGRTTLDSHLDLPFLDTDAATMASSDFLPFAAAIAQDVAGLMLSHICYKQMDDKWPASLSEIIARDLLRQQMKFNGLVISDDLDMGAIRKHYDMPTVIQRILVSEIDIALICHRSQAMEDAFDAVMAFQKASPVNREVCGRSLERIKRAKERYLKIKI